MYYSCGFLARVAASSPLDSTPCFQAKCGPSIVHLHRQDIRICTRKRTPPPPTHPPEWLQQQASGSMQCQERHAKSMIEYAALLSLERTAAVSPKAAPPD